jgi:putative ABC transport system permease protein
MQSARIALRNIARQKKRSALLGGAIAFGVLVIVVMASFTAGLLKSVQGNLSGIFGGHIYVRGEELSASGRILARIGDRRALEGALAAVMPDIAGYRVRSRARGDLIFGSRQESISVEGVDWKAEARLWDDLGIARSGRAPVSADSVVLPENVAATLGVEVGETVLFRVATITGQANVGELRVAAVYPEQQGFAIATAYTGAPHLNRLLGLGPDEYQSVNITVADMQDMDAVADALQAALARVAPVEPRGAAAGPEDSTAGHRRLMTAMAGFGSSLAKDAKRWEGTKFTVTTLNDVMAPILSLVQALNMIRMGLFGVLLAIIMVGLLNSFRMVLIERTQEIGTMRAIGMQRGGVRNAFLLEALFLSLAGAIAGVAAGVLIAAGLGSIGVARSFQIFTSGGRFAFAFVARDVSATVSILAACTLLAAWIPARKASKLRPADALRAAY